LIHHCSLSIRAVHRGEFAKAETLLRTAAEQVEILRQDLQSLPDVYYTGYVQDSLKEYAEARAVCAVITGEALPDPDAIHVDYAAYLNGLAEAVGELRRYILDALRQGNLDRCEEILAYMDDIYSVLLTMDFPDAITGNLRRTTDITRSIMEKTRGDLTLALRQERLEQWLARVERRLATQEGNGNAPSAPPSRPAPE